MKRARSVLVDLREKFLELIDHHEQLVASVGQGAIDCSADATGREDDVEHRGRRLDRNTGERCLELLERVWRRGHLHPEPVLRHRHRPGRQCRDEASPNDAGFAASTRSDNGNESSPGTRLAQPGDQPLDESLASEEVGGVSCRERPQTLVRVLDASIVERRRCEATPSASVNACPKTAAFENRREGSGSVARSSTVRTAAGSAPRIAS